MEAAATARIAGAAAAAAEVKQEQAAAAQEGEQPKKQQQQQQQPEVKAEEGQEAPAAAAADEGKAAVEGLLQGMEADVAAAEFAAQQPAKPNVSQQDGEHACFTWLGQLLLWPYWSLLTASHVFVGSIAGLCRHQPVAAGSPLDEKHTN